MEAHELVEKFRNSRKTEESYQEIVKWCGEDTKDLDLRDEDQRYLYIIATTYLMKYKIGKWNRNDAKIIINYFAKESAWKLGIDENITVYIEQHPEIIEKFPILQVGYNLDGTKKDLSQLIAERDSMLASSETPDKINELYEAIANHRNVLTGGLKGTKNELAFLDDYIARTGTDDEFIFDLIRYRLENQTKLTPEQITEVMERVYATVAKVRQKRKEHEIRHEGSKSINNGIGDGSKDQDIEY